MHKAQIDLPIGYHENSLWFDDLLERFDNDGGNRVGMGPNDSGGGFEL